MKDFKNENDKKTKHDEDISLNGYRDSKNLFIFALF